MKKVIFAVKSEYGRIYINLSFLMEDDPLIFAVCYPKKNLANQKKIETKQIICAYI